MNVEVCFASTTPVLLVTVIVTSYVPEQAEEGMFDVNVATRVSLSASPSFKMPMFFAPELTQSPGLVTVIVTVTA